MENMNVYSCEFPLFEMHARQMINTLCMFSYIQDSDALSRMQQVVLQLQAEVERVSNTMQQLVDDCNAKQKDIDVSHSLSLLH